MSAWGTVFGRVPCRLEMACKTEDSQTVKSLRCLVGLLMAGAAWSANAHGSGGLSLLQVGARYLRGEARQGRSSPQLGTWRRPDEMMEEMVGGRHAPPAFNRGLVRRQACAGDAFPSCRTANGCASGGGRGVGQGREMRLPVGRGAMEPGRNGAKPTDALHDEDHRQAVVAELYALYKPALLRRLRGWMSEQDAEGRLHEVFILALRDVSRYDGSRGSLSTWLAQIADQVRAKHHRQHVRRERAEQAYAVLETAPRGLDPAEKAEIRRLMEKLTPLNHRIVAARFLLGESVEEIAAQNGLSEEAVQKRVERSLVTLRGQVARQS